MGKMPKWAKQLQEELAPDAEIHWRKGSNRFSSGSCYYGKHIVITAGTERKNQKLVFLHELTHWLIGPMKTTGNTKHHTTEFWDKAFEIYRQYGIPMRYACQRETEYRKGALVAYRRNRKVQSRRIESCAFTIGK